MRSPMKTGFLFAFSLLPLLTGCFEIDQLIDTRRDGTIHMSLRISAPRSLQSQDEGKNWKTPTARELLHDTGRIRTRINSQDLSDDIISRRQYDFSTSRSLLRRVNEDDRGMFLPYPDGNQQWVFVFRPVPSPINGQPSHAGEKQGEAATSSLLSAATYRIFFRGAGQPRRAAFTGLDGRRVYLRATAFGDAVVVEVPILLLAGGGVLTTGQYWNLDFRRTDRLVVYLKDLGPLPLNADDENSDEADDAKKPQPAKKDQTDIPAPNASDPTTIPGPKK